MVQISKSSRHSKIVGNFGEHLACNWLSRSGFEVSIVDHTGIDVLAYSKGMNRRLGVSVKSRTRVRGKEAEAVIILQGVKDREALLAACVAFGCEPWLAIYVECETHGDLFFVSLENYERKYRVGKAVQSWRMNTSQIHKYTQDPEIKHIRIEFKSDKWWEAVP